MERLVKATCEWCGEEFEYTYCGRGMYRRFCSDKCIKNHKIRADETGEFGESRYLKGENNKLEVLMKELNAKGISYSEYKKQKAIEELARVDVNL